MSDMKSVITQNLNHAIRIGNANMLSCVLIALCSYQFNLLLDSVEFGRKNYSFLISTDQMYNI